MVSILGVVASASTTPSSIRIGLFANRPLQTVTIDGYSGLRLCGQKASGQITVILQGNTVAARDSHGHVWAERQLTVASRGGRWLDLRIDSHLKKRTVGYVVVTARDHHLQVVNVVPLETYVLGIVEGELGSVHFNPESLKAQIVASRSYVLASLGRHGREGYDFCDSPHCQTFLGTASIRPEFKLAVEVSRGQYLSYNGKPIMAFFHDSCGGRTASVQDVWGSPAVPYLQSVRDGSPDPYCRMAPHAHWTFSASRRELRDCFHREGWLEDYDALDALRVMTVDGSGRADQVLVQSNRPMWVSASDLRAAINRYYGHEVLNSTLFTVIRDKDRFRFVGRGWGHGVGLCQWGAIQMAKEGKTYKEILSHYYPGTQLERLSDPIYASAAKVSELQ